MSVNVFDSVARPNFDVGVPELAARYYGEFAYHAALVSRIGGISAAHFVEFSDRFAQLADQIYSTTEVALSLDRKHPAETTLTDETILWLRTHTGDNVPLPTDTELFTRVFPTVDAVELNLSPALGMPGMASTFAQVRWERRQQDVMWFYAQGGTGSEGRKFLANFYSKMFHTPESAPREGLEVVLGISATNALRYKHSPVTQGRKRWFG